MRHRPPIRVTNPLLATATTCVLGLALAAPAHATPNLTGEWHLDGDGADSAGSNDATTFGVTDWVPGISGQALHVDQQGGGAVMDHSIVRQFGTGDFTISFWVYYTGEFIGHARHEEPFTSGWDSSSQYILLMGERDGSALTYFALSGSGSQVTVSQVAPWIAAKNTWHHVAIGRQGTSVYMCADGVLFGSGTKTVRDMTGASTSYIGHDPANYRSFPGYLDEFQVYDGWIGTDGCASLYANPGSNLSDADGDGSNASEDCDDGDAAVHPGAEEVCDGIDNDCDGTVDGASATDALTGYADLDSDSYGDPAAELRECTLPGGYVANADDCDDGDDLVNPDGTEVCDGIDNNCDGDTDGADALGQSTWHLDLDHDDFGDPNNTVTACDAPLDGTTNADDCDDGDITINPDGIETCNGLDDDCDGATDEAGSENELTWYADADADGFGDLSSTVEACDLPPGYTADTSDCDDTDGAISPAASEVCNLVDDDCDGTADEAGALGEQVFYADADQDGHGDAAFPVNACFDTADLAESDDDCDDTEAATHPDADEYCNEVDDDCNGIVDDPTAVDAVLWYRDTDHDGYGETRRPVLACEADASFPTVNFSASAGDCRPTDAASHPGADEQCDLIDNDCDSTVDEPGSPGQPSWYADVDGDSYGAGVATHACSQPVGHRSNADDCDDGVFLVHPGATEACNDRDDDCDGTVDEAGATGEVAYYLDQDLDGYGDPATALASCDPVPGRSDDGTDCDDSSDATYPGAEERCDGEQNDCEIADWTPADEDGEVWLVDASGNWTSYTSQWAMGTDGAPRAMTLPASGTLEVCDGTYYVNLTASASGSLTIEGMYDDAVLSGGGVGSVVKVTGAGSELALVDLTLEDGAGSGTPARGGALRVSAGVVDVDGSVLQASTARDGGGLAVLGGTVTVSDSEILGNVATGSSTSSGGGFYRQTGTLTVTNTLVEGNTASYSGGGGLSSTSGTLTVVGGEVTGNTSSSGGGLMLYGSVSLTDAWLHGNSATSQGGGAFYSGGGTLALVRPVIEQNTSGASGAGLFSGGAVSCSGSSDGSYGFFANVAATGAGLGMYTAATFTGSYCSFGTTTADNNAPVDIQAGTRSYNYGNEASLTCTAGRCRTP